MSLKRGGKIKRPPDGMKALADFIRTVPKAPKIMVCGMMSNKDWQTSIGYISRYIDIHNNNAAFFCLKVNKSNRRCDLELGTVSTQIVYYRTNYLLQIFFEKNLLQFI